MTTDITERIPLLGYGIDKCFDNSLLFFINQCNIRGLHSDFYVEHYFSYPKPHLLFLAEKQTYESTVCNFYSVSSYYLHSNVQSKAECCFYEGNGITCWRAHDFDFSELSVFWLTLNQKCLNKYFCAIYLSPNYKLCNFFFFIL